MIVLFLLIVIEGPSNISLQHSQFFPHFCTDFTDFWEENAALHKCSLRFFGWSFAKIIFLFSNVHFIVSLVSRTLMLFLMILSIWALLGLFVDIVTRADSLFLVFGLRNSSSVSLFAFVIPWSIMYVGYPFSFSNFLQ